MTQEAPYGSWKSPVTADLVASGANRLNEIVLDGDDIYWLEMRPAERGRYVVMKHTPGGETSDVVPTPFNARTRVHEYGGGAYTVSNGTLYFSNFADQRIYRQEPGGSPVALTPEEDKRYADYTVDHRRNRLICVCEDHTRGEQQVENSIVSLSLQAGGDVRVLASGNDFYASLSLSPDGKRLAWITWNHPNMPWDGTELWIGEINPDGTIGQSHKIAGGKDESIFQPQWSPDGTLYFISDRSGWWNLYRLSAGQIESLYEMDADFGLPQWVFGMSTYDFRSADELVCTYTQQGQWYLARLDTKQHRLEPVNTAYTGIDSLRAAPEKVVFIGGSPTQTPSVVALNLASGKSEVLRQPSSLQVDPGYISTPQPVEFPTENGLTAHGIFYPPQNKDYHAPPNELPPLIVISHGGPTSATSTTLKLAVQFWTSRGFAILDVNYGGSTGYGRAYRERLKNQWGITDVDDCVNGALYLADQGLVDRNRLAIRGGSAGGYTTLSALAFRDIFKAGASHFGIGDLEALARDTHKFESRYLDSLIGPYPERRDLYQERSPLMAVDRLNAPLIFFQGLEDKVVPPSQAEMMVAALREKGIPVAYVPFEGEQHGFRRAENIQRSLEAELYFYSQIFGFPLAEQIEPVAIENLPVKE